MSFVFIVFMFLLITLISHKVADVFHSIAIPPVFLDLHNCISKHKLKINANKASPYCRQSDHEMNQTDIYLQRFYYKFHLNMF
jgi:hypothetical protein